MPRLNILLAAVPFTLATVPAVLAQAELVGTWEFSAVDNGGTFRIVLQADHTFVYVATFELSLSGAETVAVYGIPLYANGDAMEGIVKGSWEVGDGELTLRPETVEWLINELTVEQYIDEFTRQHATGLAEEQGIPVEEFDDFVASLEQQLSEAFTTDMDQATGRYEVDGDTLTLFDDSGETELTRITPSVVRQTSWGHFKSLHLR
jgi:hypothetical protein